MVKLLTVQSQDSPALTSWIWFMARSTQNSSQLDRLAERNGKTRFWETRAALICALTWEEVLLNTVKLTPENGISVQKLYVHFKKCTHTLFIPDKCLSLMEPQLATMSYWVAHAVPYMNTVCARACACVYACTWGGRRSGKSLFSVLHRAIFERLLLFLRNSQGIAHYKS